MGARGMEACLEGGRQCNRYTSIERSRDGEIEKGMERLPWWRDGNRLFVPKGGNNTG